MAEPTAPTAPDMDAPGALQVDKILQQVSKDDEDEWEYEYSTTEIEVWQILRNSFQNAVIVLTHFRHIT